MQIQLVAVAHGTTNKCIKKRFTHVASSYAKLLEQKNDFT